jgi:cytoskeletal protein RodZ
MTAIGEQLRSARERKGLTLDRVCDETNIAKRYLAALEDEDFSVFPGDPYAIGFLRNYADYLGLNSNELVASFKSMRIQEQPVPLEDLLPRRGPSHFAVIGIAGAALVVVAAVLAVVFSQGRGKAQGTAAVEHKPVEYSITGGSLEKRLYVGDSILVRSEKDNYKIVISRIDDAVTLETPVGASRLMLGEEGSLDFDRDNQPDLTVLVSDLAKRSPEKGALVKMSLSSALAASAAQAAVEGGDNPAQGTAAGASAAAAGTSATASALPTSGTAPATTPPAAGGKSVLIFEATKSPHPFVVSVSFRGSCLFRYEVDKRDRDERYYRKGETVTVNANNSVKIWASNAQSAKLTIMASGGKSADLDLGSAGAVSVKRIAWAQTETGTWALSASDVD